MQKLSRHFRLILGIGFALGLANVASADVAIPGVDGSKLDPALKGRVLVEELNCAACHQSDAVVTSSRKAPRLSAVGGRVNPEYLRAFLEAPHEVKPGTMMPDLLADLEEPERKDIAQSLTHYLVSLSKAEPFAQSAPDAVAAEAGEKLFHSVGCVACHAPRDAEGTELLPEASVPLGALEKKYSHRSLREFLTRPHAVRPSGRMPDLQLPGQEVDRIAHYLLRNVRVPGHLAYTTWRGNVWEGLDGDVEKEKGGQVDDFSLERFGKLQHQTAVRYSGFLKVEVAGEFTFYLDWNGGNLLINGAEVAAEAPSNRRGTKKIQGKADLRAGWNAIELTYFHTGRDPGLSFEMEGPGFARGAIPSGMLATSDQPIPVVEPLKIDAGLALKGKAHFEQLGCAQCHDDIKSPPLEFLPLAKVDPAGGCLAGAKGAPRFDLSDQQTALIQDVLPDLATQSLSDPQVVDKTLATYNCIACHDRAGLGGISPERNAYFTGTHEALGDQGRLPPPLTHVGAKLTKEWLAEVMLRGGRQRDYLNTRMPQFGEPQVGHLVEAFGKVDVLEEASLPKVASIKESKEAGYEMMGTTGFSCIACHDYNGEKSEGVGALDLVHMTDRIQKNWFHLYMRQPSRFHPTVIMPSYWPGGESIRKELLGGSTDRQIEALWTYLADGPRAKKPKGLSRLSPELRVADETLMCRGRGTAGYRGIGVGYPERISLAFDSEEMAVRLFWKGEFASVNNGSFRARGGEQFPFPAGIPFHRLESMDAAWPYKGKTDYLFPQDHGYRYQGYSLDKAKRPTFRYRYGEIEVEDFFEDLLDEQGRAYFKRTMTFAAPKKQEPFFFRVASGKEVEEAEKGWQIDRMNVRLSGDYDSVRVREGDPEELLVPLELPEGKTEIQLEYRW